MKNSTKILYVAFLIVIILAFLISFKVLNSQKTDEIVWNSPNESFTTDFIVGKSGLFYLQAKVNNVNGLYLFDTGCTTTEVNTYILPKESETKRRYTVRDSYGNKQTKNLHEINSFELGDLLIKKLDVFPADSIPDDYISNNSIQDKKLGIIGNNIISEFVWDFDLVNRRVTISKDNNYCKNIQDSLAVKLVSKNNLKEIPLLINGKNKNLVLDFGCSAPIIVTDSIQDSGTNIFLNNLDINNYDFADVQFGDNIFSEIKCIKNKHVNLFGIPFIWAFKRVILDYNNDKIYFISKSDSKTNYSVNKYKLSYINANSTITMETKPNGLKFVVGNDSNQKKYRLFGRIKLYQNNNKLDSILCLDSLYMPNGQLKNGPTTIKVLSPETKK